MVASPPTAANSPIIIPLGTLSPLPAPRKVCNPVVVAAAVVPTPGAVLRVVAPAATAVVAAGVTETTVFVAGAPAAKPILGPPVVAVGRMVVNWTCGTITVVMIVVTVLETETLG